MVANNRMRASATSNAARDPAIFFNPYQEKEPEAVFIHSGWTIKHPRGLSLELCLLSCSLSQCSPRWPWTSGHFAEHHASPQLSYRSWRINCKNPRACHIGPVGSGTFVNSIPPTTQEKHGVCVLKKYALHSEYFSDSSNKQLWVRPRVRKLCHGPGHSASRSNTWVIWFSRPSGAGNICGKQRCGVASPL